MADNSYAQQQSLWGNLDKEILGIVLNELIRLYEGKVSRSKLVYLMQNVHPNWRRRMSYHAGRIRPRLSPITASFEDCMNTLATIPFVRNLALPLLGQEDGMDFSRFTAVASCVSLELSYVNLSTAVNTSLHALNNLRELRLVDVTVTSVLLDSLSEQKYLELLSVEDVRLAGKRACNALSFLPDQLQSLEIVNCPDLLVNGFLRLMDLSALRDFRLSTDMIHVADIYILAAISAEISLNLNGDVDPYLLLSLRAIPRLIFLKLEGFSAMDFPTFILDWDLRSLHLCPKDTLRLANDEEMSNLTPSSLESLEIAVSCVDGSAIASLLRVAPRLCHLGLHVSKFTTNVDLSPCTTLRSLRISGDELDAVAVQSVTCLIDLESLQISNCLDLDAEHIKYLSELPKLKALSFTSSCFTNACFDEFSRLENITSLSFYYCPALSPQHFREMPNLNRLHLGLCPMIENDLEMLFSKAFISNLDFLGFKFFNTDQIMHLIHQFHDRVPHMIIDTKIQLPK